MNDDYESELIRRLREEGQAAAPPDLQTEVMAQVAAEPRRKRARNHRLWRPVLATAAVACAVGGVAIGLSNLGGTSSSSSMSASSAAASGTSRAAAAEGSPSAAGHVYTVPAGAAAKILGARSPVPLLNLDANGYKAATAKIPTILVKLPVKGSSAYESRLRRAEARFKQLGDTGSTHNPVRVILVPPRTAGTSP